MLSGADVDDSDALSGQLSTSDTKSVTAVTDLHARPFGCALHSQPLKRILIADIQ